MILSNKKLQKACDARRSRELKAIWPEDELSEDTGSDAILFHRRGYQTAAAFLCVLLMLAGWLFLDKTASASVGAWIREVAGSWFTVRPVSKGSEAAFCHYRLGWLPERFARPLWEEKEADRYAAEYEAGKEWLAWGYCRIAAQDDLVLRVGYFDPEKNAWNITKEETLLIDGREVLCYAYTLNTTLVTEGKQQTIPRDFICCVWTDAEADTVFRLDGNVTKEEAIRIIESIKKAD